MLKEYFLEKVNASVTELVEQGKLGQMKKEDAFSFQADVPKNAQFGDFAVNVASLARYAKMAPPVIAQTIVKHIEAVNFSIKVVAGFINFKLENEFLNQVVVDILNKKENYLKSDVGKGEKVNIEYVSANPTGPFHIGHGRWAALGSALANIMKYCNYDVFQEFYINDAGNQINKL